MPGTREGGLKAAAKNKARDPNFYAKIGARGGRNSNTGGFAFPKICDGECDLDHLFGLDHRVAQCAGYKGGAKSRRGRKKVTRA